MDTLTADMLAEALQEPKKSLLAKVLKTIGQERCQALFTEACTLEASGGMLTADGTRRRTPGGTFFHLVRQQCSKEERARLFPYRATKNPSRSPSTHGLTRPLCPSPSTCGKDSPLCMSPQP